MWNNSYQGGYGRTPSTGGYGNPPGMGPPGAQGSFGNASAGAPGTFPPPGMQPPNQAQAPAGLPANFQPPANINFNAPVIRMGGGGPTRNETPSNTNERRRDQHNQDQGGNRRRAGIGHDGGNTDQSHQHNKYAARPLTHEQLMRTIFIGNITPACWDNETLERILGVGGGLYGWTRPVDSQNKVMSWGFAEYEDADSLDVAVKTLSGAEIPLERPKEGEMETNEDRPTKKLNVVIDASSQKYIDDWRAKGSMQTDEQAQFRIDSGKEELASIVAELSRPIEAGARDVNGEPKPAVPAATIDAETGEIVHINIEPEDELGDIPAAERERVRQEIKDFRSRAEQRDMERLRREEEMERQANTGIRNNRTTSTTGGANAIPVGPRDRGAKGVPTGPKGLHQSYRDQQNGTANGDAGYTEWDLDILDMHSSDDDRSTDDEELERRREVKRKEMQRKDMQGRLNRWLHQENIKANYNERQRAKEKDEARRAEDNKARAWKQHAEFNDHSESFRRNELFYRDRNAWYRQRQKYRHQEKKDDLEDARREEEEKAAEDRRKNREIDMADAFLDQHAEELQTRAKARPQRFTMSLSNSARRAAETNASRKVQLMEFMEDEDENEAPKKRELVPLNFDENDVPEMTEDERREAIHNLAGSIPTDSAELFAWPVKWNYLDGEMIEGHLRNFINAKIVDLLGGPEEMLTDTIEGYLKKHSPPSELVKELHEVLEDEAEALVKKLWRMVVFYTEAESKGLEV